MIEEEGEVVGVGVGQVEEEVNHQVGEGMQRLVQTKQQRGRYLSGQPLGSELN